VIIRERVSSGRSLNAESIWFSYTIADRGRSPRRCDWFLDKDDEEGNGGTQQVFMIASLFLGVV
jgi:hypothetical protein